MYIMAIMKLDPIPKEVVEVCRRLGERIRNARLLRKWRQQDVANRTGYARGTVVKVEKGDPKTNLGIYPMHCLHQFHLARCVAGF